MSTTGITIIQPRQDALTGFLNPAAMCRDLWGHRYLIWQFAWRDVTGRYKGSRLGMIWSVGNPLLMLAIYTFVFGTIFKSSWPGSHTGFAITMFCGLTVFNLFSECVVRSPLLIVANVNYVKKVVFPLQVLVVSTAVSALFFAAINVCILVVALVCLHGGLSWTALCFGLIVFPTLLLGMGFGWLLASLGVYLRDVGQMIVIVMQMLFFVTPIFYPITAVPQSLQAIVGLNPLAHLVEGARRTMLWGQPPEWGWLLAVTLLAAVAAQLGYAWFMKTKKGFADVL